MTESRASTEHAGNYDRDLSLLRGRRFMLDLRILHTRTVQMCEIGETWRMGSFRGMEELSEGVTPRKLPERVTAK